MSDRRERTERTTHLRRLLTTHPHRVPRVTDLSPLFRDLIDDRPGNFATLIVDALMSQPYHFPLAVETMAGGLWYRITFTLQPRPLRTVLSSRHAYIGDRQDSDNGPSVESLSWPGSWSALECFRLAEAIDRAFRGHNMAFDNTIA